MPVCYVYTEALRVENEIKEREMTRTAARALAKNLFPNDFTLIEVRDCKTHKVVSKYK